MFGSIYGECFFKLRIYIFNFRVMFRQQQQQDEHMAHVSKKKI